MRSTYSFCRRDHPPTKRHPIQHRFTFGCFSRHILWNFPPSNGARVAQHRGSLTNDLSPNCLKVSLKSASALACGSWLRLASRSVFSERYLSPKLGENRYSNYLKLATFERKYLFPNYHLQYLYL